MFRHKIKTIKCTVMVKEKYNYILETKIRVKNFE